MSAHRFLIALCCTTLPLAAACAPQEDDFEDDLAGELAAEGEAGKADDHGTFTYYSVRRDHRRCVSPVCGGFWVSRVNRAKTECADGRLRAECYVAELDDAALGLSEEQDLLGNIEAGKILLRGEVVAQTYGEFGNLGRFVASEAWQAGSAAGVIDGVFVKVELNGVRCAAAPCPDKSELKLNSVRTANIADLDLEASGATEDELVPAYEAFTGPGVIVVGERYTVRGPGGRAKARTANQFWTQLSAAPSDGCYVGGCAGQVCSDDPDVNTICDWRDEYACYASASCERQADGACGWTMTEELSSCLADPTQAE